MMQKTTRYLIFFTILSLPAYLFRFSVFGVPTNMLEILIILTFVSWLSDPKFGSKLDKKHIIPAGLIILGLIVSILLNKNYVQGFGILKGWFILPLLFSFVALQVLTLEKRKDIFKAYFLSAAAVAFLGIFYFLSGKMTYDGRLEIFFNSPNYLAMYLAPGLLFGIVYLIFDLRDHSSKNERIFYIASLPIILATFYLTYSYAAWVAVVISLFAALWMKNKKFLRNTSIAILLVFIISLTQINSEKFKNMAESPRSSLESRLVIWKAAAEILEDNFIFGIGPGNFQDKYLEYQKFFPPYLEWAVPHPHNLYLAFWLYSGVIGLAGFLLLVIFWFVEIFKQEKNAFWMATVGIMLYFLIHGLADTTYFKNDLAVVFWLNFIILLQVNPEKLSISAVREKKHAFVKIKK